MQKVVVGRWRQQTACVRHCSDLFSFLYFRQNLSKWSTAFEKLSLFIVHFQKRSKNGVKTLFCMIAQFIFHRQFTFHFYVIKTAKIQIQFHLFQFNHMCCKIVKINVTIVKIIQYYTILYHTILYYTLNIRYQSVDLG